MTRKERDHMNAVTRLGCIVCRKFGMHSQPEIHHVRIGNEPRNHFKTIGLCPPHHRGKYGVAFHAGQETWERTYGNQSDLLREVEMLLE